MAEKLVYSPKEVGELLGLGRSSTYEALAEGRIPSIRVGRKLLIPKAGLIKLLQGEAEPVVSEVCTKEAHGRSKQTKSPDSRVVG